MTAHVVLLGDSVFDNRAYTGGAPAVIAHLGKLLPPAWRASLLAVDGTTTADFDRQLAAVPTTASHVVISLGGNDALMNADVLDLPVVSTAQALLLLGERSARFEAAYREALASAIALGCDTTVCTIYNGHLEPREATLARVALMTFNDVILRVAFEHRIAVIDLRGICTEPGDFVSGVEPSATGGAKIAKAVARSIGAVDGAKKSSVLATR